MRARCVVVWASVFSGVAGVAEGATVSFQYGAAMSDGLIYYSAFDTELLQASPTTDRGSATTISTDLEVTGGNPATQAQSILKFNQIFGSTPTQVPLGSTINSVTLTFNTLNVSASSTSMYSMLTPWTEQTTWSSIGGGVATNGTVASSTAAVTFTPSALGTLNVSGAGLTSSVQAWSNGAANHGWALKANGTDGWQFASTENSTVASRPKLTIDYTAPTVPAAAPKNVILFVGDGMGLEAVKAAKLKLFGNTTSSFAFEFAQQGRMLHNNVSNALTDSAASATAMATGVKVANQVISQSGTTELKTALEILKERGKRTGLVTTGTAITDATPAAFGAHDLDRDNQVDIGNDFVNGSRPNILFGQPGGMSSTPTNYLKITTQTELQNLNTNTEFVSGHFSGVNSTSGPSLSLMATKAMDVLSKDPDGFFLMVENEDTDAGGHSNNITQVIDGVASLNLAVQDTIAWLTAKGELDDTLIIVLADHETGGLTVVNGNGQGVNPTVTWTTTGHTTTPIGAWAMGPGSEMMTDYFDNTDVFRMLTIPEPSGLAWLLMGAGLLRRRRRLPA